MCLSMTIVKCIKQHQSKTWSSFHDKVKQHWDWVEKSVAYKEEHVFVLVEDDITK